jgi:hypothetical protein
MSCMLPLFSRKAPIGLWKISVKVKPALQPVRRFSILKPSRPTAGFPPWPGPSVVERVTRIELALSAWEAERLRLFDVLTWQIRCSVVTVVDPSSPRLMAR